MSPPAPGKSSREHPDPRAPVSASSLRLPDWRLSYAVLLLALLGVGVKGIEKKGGQK